MCLKQPENLTKETSRLLFLCYYISVFRLTARRYGVYFSFRGGSPPLLPNESSEKTKSRTGVLTILLPFSYQVRQLSAHPSRSVGPFFCSSATTAFSAIYQTHFKPRLRHRGGTESPMIFFGSLYHVNLLLHLYIMEGRGEGQIDKEDFQFSRNERMM